MNRVRAFVVGVSRYQVDGWSLPGPARNAAIIGRRLLDLGLSPDRLHLFAEANDMDAADVKRFEDAGVALQATSYRDIDDFWRVSLRNLAAQGDVLLVYWSGHGVIDEGDARIFYCSDYLPAVPQRVFDALHFARHMKASPFSAFQDQIILADVCGTYVQATTPPRDGVGTRRAGVRQLAVWATPDGAYAREENGVGRFTLVMDSLLAGLRGDTWPNPDQWLARIRSSTEDWPNAPTSLSWHSPSGAATTLLGEIDERAALTRSLLELLGQYSLPEAVTRRAWANTVRNLGLSAPVNLALPEAIAELADLSDSWNSGAPFSLTQFLIRVRDDPDLHAEPVRAPLADWIAKNSITYVRELVQHALDEERQTMLLLVDVDTDQSGKLSGITTYLRYPDLLPVPGFETQKLPVADPAALSATLREVLEQKVMQLSASAIEVHLLLDPPAFGLPLQLLDMASGLSLGEDHICIVHYRRRAKTHAGPIVEDWRTWLGAFADPIDTNNIHSLPPPPLAVPAAQGIYYLNDPVDNAMADPAAWRQLERLLRRGAPYLCWPIVDGGIAPVLPAALNDLFGDRYDGVPRRVFDERLRGCPNARAISVLWDGPTFRPFDYQDLKGMA